MSVTANVSVARAVSADASRTQPHFWTPFLILVAIAVCALAASFYVDAPPIDALLVGP
jgi:hypothetical protein